MQYLLMVYQDETTWAEATPQTLEAMTRKFNEYAQSIVKSGHYRTGAQLQPTTTATTIRMKNEKPFTMDGPFAETKEQIGGYFVVDCKDLDEALSLAKRIPSLQPMGDSVEVRPLVPKPGIY